MAHEHKRFSAAALLLSRGIRCVVLHPNDEDGETLTNHLRRMGFKVQAFWPIPDELPDDTDLIFYALQSDDPSPDVSWYKPAKHALIAVIAYENPTFIDQALNMNAGASITTPVRASGLLSAMVFALHHSRQQRLFHDKIERLEKKVLGIRQVSEAKAILMRMHNIGEEQAYEILRHQAMDKRISIEEISGSLIQANEILAWTTPPDSGQRKN
ncbi:ANTAR domain-containing response regulator [Klebsiella sp. BIGb0407]|uniref:ANTAR domain-containing response regulator n=1 Tax=Klebsiella sp. BIGb0407 TaxID=2940603 RepID=UPI002166D1A0|nr:ANTAR domain-containing protein [Klebsiella sp. BIGb0407]MCS3429904.1 AmiR/NasT family two-component response regulator [Klebsiella sp. BIGb0407]